MIEDVRRLRAAHGALRSDLELLRSSLDRLADDSDPTSVAAQIDSLALKRHSWQVASFCSRYCATVHVHHQIEDDDLFVALEAHQPALRPAIRELVAEHLELSRLIDELDAAVRQLPGDRDARARAAAAAERVADRLEAHLVREEAALLPALATLPSSV